MADESIKITIGAVKSASIDRVFEDIRKKAARIGQDLNRLLNPKSAVRGLEVYRTKLAEVAQQVKESDKIRLIGPRRQLTEEQRLHREKLRQIAVEQRERERAVRYVNGIRARHEMGAYRDQQRLLRQQEANERRFARMVSHRTTRFIAPEMPMVSMARRGANAIAQGIGLDLSGASAIRSAVENQATAVRLANAAWNPNDPDPNSAARTRVDPRMLNLRAMDVGAKYGFEAGDVLRGLGLYTKKTGDLDTASQMLDELSALAAATGSDLEQLYGAAGALSNQLETIPAGAERSKSILGLLKAFGGQGKLGSVELEDISRYGARIASTANLYEGDREQNLRQLGILAQAAAKFGGADSAAMAATSVARLATTFKTNARVKAFEKQGIDVTNEQGQLKNPIELIKAALVATRTDPTEFNKLFMNIMGARGAEGLGGQFRDARIAALKSGATDEVATQAGLKAIDDFVKEMEKAAISQDQINKAVEQVQGTYQARVNELNIEFQKVATEFLDEFLPKLKDAGPAIKNFARTLGDLSVWIVENPKTAIASAVGISIARAGIESVFRVGIEKGIAAGFSGAPELVKAAVARMFGASVVPPAGAAPVAPVGAGAAALAGAGMFAGGAALAAAASLPVYYAAKSLTAQSNAERAANVAASEDTGDGSLQAKLAQLEARNRVLDQDVSLGQSRGAFSGLAGPSAEQTSRVAELITEQRKVAAEMSQVKALLAGGINVNVNGQPPGRTTQDGNR